MRSIIEKEVVFVLLNHNRVFFLFVSQTLYHPKSWLPNFIFPVVFDLPPLLTLLPVLYFRFSVLWLFSLLRLSWLFISLFPVWSRGSSGVEKQDSVWLSRHTGNLGGDHRGSWQGIKSWRRRVQVPKPGFEMIPLVLYILHVMFQQSRHFYITKYSNIKVQIEQKGHRIEKQQP